MVDAVIKGSAIEKSYDNLTVVKIVFKNLLTFFEKKDEEVKELQDTESQQSKAFNIQEQEQIQRETDRVNESSQAKRAFLEKLVKNKRGESEDTRYKTQFSPERARNSNHIDQLPQLKSSSIY